MDLGYSLRTFSLTKSPPVTARVRSFSCGREVVMESLYDNRSAFMGKVFFVDRMLKSISFPDRARLITAYAKNVPSGRPLKYAS
jgi:hypothetical protein